MKIKIKIQNSKIFTELTEMVIPPRIELHLTA